MIMQLFMEFTHPELKDLILLWVWKMLPPLSPHQETHAGFLQLPSCSSDLWTLGLSSHDVTLVGGNSRCRQWWVWAWWQIFVRDWETLPWICLISQGQWGLPKSKGQDFLWSLGCFSSRFAFLSLSDLVQVIHINYKAQHPHVWSERIEWVQ